jgi:hypothetical protein
MSGEEKFIGVVNSNEVGEDLTETSSVNSGKRHIFDDPKVAAYYRNLYEEKQFECRHLFDPELEWTPQEEKSLVRRIDLRVTLWAFVMFMALDFDRNNISQALSDNMLTDLKLTTADYNLGTTINLVCFLGAELPSQLISKKIGPDRWIPMQMVLWSAVAIAQTKMVNRGGFLATRALIGLLEGGFIPDICLWLSYFYTSKELTWRLSLFYIANPLASIVTSLLAFAIFRLSGQNGLQGWRWLFLIEGVITLAAGLVSFFRMPASIVQTKTWFRKSGWWKSDRQQSIAVNRVLRDDPSKGDMHNREAVTVKGLFKSLIDYDLWPIFLIRYLGDINAQPTKNYMTLTLRYLGFSPFNTNLLTIPYSFVNILFLFVSPWLVSKGNYTWSYLVQPLWNLPCLIALRYWPGAQKEVWPTYALLTILLSGPQMWAVSIGWCSANSNSVRMRTVSAAIVNMASQAASITSANIYQPHDAPLYHRGNVALIIISIFSLLSVIFANVYYRYRNHTRDKIWKSMTLEQQHDYVESTTDRGNKRLDFRFSF